MAEKLGEEMAGKLVVGYCEPLSLRTGDTVRLHAASHRPTRADVDVVRIVCGNHRRFHEEHVLDVARGVELDEPAYPAGSWAAVPVRTGGPADLAVDVWPTGDDGDVITTGDLVVRLAHGHVEVIVGGRPAARAPRPLRLRRWYRLTLDDTLTIEPLLRGRPGEHEPDMAVPLDAPARLETGTLRLAGGGFDGRLARLRIGDERHHLPDADLHQLPTTGVPGPGWDGTQLDWRQAPEHYDAVHFHHDDVYDVDWLVTAELTLPDDLASGVYAFRVESEAGTDRVPFFVAPGRGRPTADVAFLAPVATYLAYANHRMAIEGSDFFPARSRLRPEQQYLVDHPEVGLSHYEHHRDGSGVVFSSRLRPILNLRPGADGWGFTPDTDIVAFLDHTGIPFDVVTDEQLDAEGAGALAPYRVVVTGSHPEYWSTAMLDGLEAFQRAGGRLMYLGGNGLYWRVAFSDRWPGAMEVRRAEDGTRAWETGPGEAFHVFTGEYGGLWRRLGRPPNLLTGVGFVAQGFDRATSYERTAASRDERAAWIFEGVDADRIGAAGVGGGAAGQEVDRFDAELGSPPHALVLASASDFGEDMLRTKEEFLASVPTAFPDQRVRADIVFYETPAGGAVFSVGSIAWWGALATDRYDNDVARITGNVLRRFADPEPFTVPGG
jgi:N,N-dimethylformamidase